MPWISPLEVRVASPNACNPEVADQGRAVLGDQDVARFDVSVDDAHRVGGWSADATCAPT